MTESCHNVFISYSRSDAKAAEILASYLSEAGVPVWLDHWELAAGERWEESVKSAILSASAVIVCIGTSGVSQWQRGETSIALQLEATASRSKPLIPVLLPGANATTVPEEFNARVWVDFRRGFDDRREFSRLIAALQALDTNSELEREELTGDTLADSGNSSVHYERALRIARATYGTKHPKITTLLTKLGMSKQRTGDLVSAKTLLEEALEVAISLSGDASVEASSALNNLGSVLRDTGDLVTARAFFERALAIDEKALGPDHPSVANRLNNLGSVLRDMGDFAAARAFFEPWP
jgi:tetratricopeptide (TPR) repeat protein